MLVASGFSLAAITTTSCDDADKKITIPEDLKWKPSGSTTAPKAHETERSPPAAAPQPELADTALLSKAKGVGDTASNIESTILREGLRTIYETHIRPLEERSCFGDYYSEPLTASDFDAKPNVLVLGQYSVGKTTSLRYLLGQDRHAPRPNANAHPGPWCRILPRCGSGQSPPPTTSRCGPARMLALAHIRTRNPNRSKTRTRTPV